MIRESALPTIPSTCKPADLVARLRGFAHGQGGMAAVEFAVILPFMLAAYLGGVELGNGVAINRKVAITTRAVADLATRYTTIHNADSTTILGAASTIIAPYASGPLAVTVSQVSVNAQGTATISWSDTLNGTAHPVGTAVTLPGTLATPNANYIWGEVSYAYTPTFGYVMTGTYNLSDQIFMSPRQSASVTRVP
jgi:Flp pilus assembly protein TadG